MVNLPKHPEPKVRQTLDGSLWEASWPRPGESEYSIYSSLFDPEAPKFWFRKLSPNPNRYWWCPWRPRWIRTGEIWEGNSPPKGGFELL